MDLQLYWMGAVLLDGTVIFPPQNNTRVHSELDWVESFKSIGMPRKENRIVGVQILKGKIKVYPPSAAEILAMRDIFANETIKFVKISNVNGESYTISRKEWEEVVEQNKNKSIMKIDNPEAFVKAYEKAVEQGKDAFTYRGREVLTKYAQYVVEYLRDISHPPTPPSQPDKSESEEK